MEINDPSLDLTYRYQNAIAEFKLTNRDIAVDWAKEVIAHKERFLIVEALIANIRTKEIVEIAAIDLDGNKQFDLLMRPQTIIGGSAYYHRKLRIEELESRDTWRDNISKLECLQDKVLLMNNWCFYKFALAATNKIYHQSQWYLDGVDIGAIYAMFRMQWDDDRREYNSQERSTPENPSIVRCHHWRRSLEEMAYTDLEVPF